MAIGISAISGSDAPGALIEAGYRTFPKRTASLRKNCPDDPRFQEILNRATAD